MRTCVTHNLSQPAVLAGCSLHAVLWCTCLLCLLGEHEGSARLATRPCLKIQLLVLVCVVLEQSSGFDHGPNCPCFSCRSLDSMAPTRPGSVGGFALPTVFDGGSGPKVIAIALSDVISLVRHTYA